MRIAIQNSNADAFDSDKETNVSFNHRNITLSNLMCTLVVPSLIVSAQAQTAPSVSVTQKTKSRFPKVGQANPQANPQAIPAGAADPTKTNPVPPVPSTAAPAAVPAEPEAKTPVSSNPSSPLIETPAASNAPLDLPSSSSAAPETSVGNAPFKEFFMEFKSLAFQTNQGSHKFKPIGGSQFTSKINNASLGYLSQPLLIQLKQGFRLELAPQGNAFSVGLQRGVVMGPWEFGAEIKEASLSNQTVDVNESQSNTTKVRRFKLGPYLRGHTQPFKTPGEHTLSFGLDSRYSYLTDRGTKQITEDGTGMYLFGSSYLFFPVKAAPYIHYAIGAQFQYTYLDLSRSVLGGAIGSKKGHQLDFTLNFAGLRATF